MEKYSERFNDIVILQLETKGFEKLTEKQQKLAYYLSQAGLWGRAISLDQGSVYNTSLINSLMELYNKVDENEPLHQQIHDSLFILFAHNGLYHSTSGEILSLPVTLENLNSYEKIEPQLVETIRSIWFSGNIKQFRTVQTEDTDIVAQSGGNFYHNLTTQEVKAYRENNYPSVSNDEIPPFGFNERLVKYNNGIISRETISENGLYGQYVKRIIDNLEKSLDFTENEQQQQSITTLITFYKTGDAADFDKHCVAWTKDRDSHVYFINGLIESYEDHY